MVKTRSKVQLIVRTPGVQGGEPVIRGTRVPVRSIALARDEDGLTPSAIAEEFCVDLAAVEAALAYYDAHKAEIDRIIDRHERETYAV
jgi:uncharacterized protein (DUF433 family)